MAVDIYDLHAQAFSRVLAFVILKDGEMVAKVAIKLPAAGAGRLYAYVHCIGAPMVRGVANGYGYDKRSAAVGDAARVLRPSPAHSRAVPAPLATAFVEALVDDDRPGRGWVQCLAGAGFTVIQAV